MATSKLDILINAKNNASGTLKTVGRDAESLGSMARVAAAGVAAMGAAFAAAKLAQGVYDITRMAEEGQYLKAAFDDMAKSAGQSSDKMLAAMRSASQGMVSDVDLVRSANRAMLLGVADDAEEMASLLEVASKRGRAMGLSTAQAFNDIVTGIGRMSPMILDNLGIVFDSEQVFSEYANTLGKTAEQLTDVERKHALLNATVASTANMATPVVSEFEKMDAALANAKQALGELFSPAVAAAARSIAEEVKATADEIKYLQGLLDKRSLSKTQNEMSAIAKSTAMAKEELARLAAILETLEKGSIRYINTADKMAELEALIGQNAIDMGSKMVIASHAANSFATSLDSLRMMAFDAAQGISAAAAATSTMAYNYSKVDSLNIDLIAGGKWADKADLATVSTRGLSSAVGDLNSEFEGLKSKVSGILTGAIGDTAGIDADDLLPDPVRIDENARRLADIAVDGFKGQDWLGDFAAEVPDIFAQLEGAADPRAAAAQLLDDFQDGFINGTGALINKDAAKDRVRRMLLGEQSTAALAEEIAQELSAEMGISIAKARATTGAALGAGGGSSSVEIAPTIDQSKIPPITIVGKVQIDDTAFKTLTSGLPCIPINVCEDSITTSLATMESLTVPVSPTIGTLTEEDIIGIQAQFGSIAGPTITPQMGTFTQQQIMDMTTGMNAAVAENESMFRSVGGQMGWFVQSGFNANVDTATMATNLTDGLMSEVTASNIGQEVALEIAAQLNNQSETIINSGKRAANTWSGGFLQQVEERVPTRLIEILAMEVAPVVADLLAEEAGRSDSPPNPLASPFD